MSQHDQVRLTAEGLIRNFGHDAISEAERLAQRYANQPEPHALWVAVAEQLKSITRAK